MYMDICFVYVLNNVSHNIQIDLNILCVNTFGRHSELLCLDWRDGLVQKMPRKVKKNLLKIGSLLMVDEWLLHWDFL